MVKSEITSYTTLAISGGLGYTYLQIAPSPQEPVNIVLAPLPAVLAWIAGYGLALTEQKTGTEDDTQ